MRLIVVFVGAYLLTAIFYVWRDMSETSVVREAFYIGRYRQDRRLVPLSRSLLAAGDGAFIAC
jgi:hypothetical protein